MLSELQKQLKQKQADIELAASVGQALLEEIDFLKKKLNEKNSQERKFSTPKSSRQLKNAVEFQESPLKDTKDLHDTIQTLKVEKQNLHKKNEKLIKQCEAINESCWNLEIENQNLTDSLKDQRILLEKSLESARNLQSAERQLRMDHDNYRNLYESCQTRNKELEISLNNLKRKQVLEPIEIVVKDIVQSKSVSVQVNQEEFTYLPMPQTKREEIPRADESFLSTISHLQTENAILGLNNEDLKRINQELEKGMQDSSLKEFRHESSQTDLEYKDHYQISDTAHLLLMENELNNIWEIKRHIGIQAPSILQADGYHDLLIQKKQRFKLESRNAESAIEEIQDYEDFPAQNMQVTSERISSIFAGPAPGENMIDALVYTMIGSWNGKNPKLRYFWVNPYSRTLHWAKTSPSQGNPRSATRIGNLSKVILVPINSITWNEDTQTIKNYSPAEIDSLEIRTTNRIIKIQPLNWADRDLWISGLTILLKRSNEKSLTEEAATEAIQVKAWHENQSFTGSHSSLGRRSSLGPRSLHSSPKKSASHRRSMTIIANEETPKKSKFTFNAM